MTGMGLMFLGLMLYACVERVVEYDKELRKEAADAKLKASHPADDVQ